MVLSHVSRRPPLRYSSSLPGMTEELLAPPPTSYSRSLVSPTGLSIIQVSTAYHTVGMRCVRAHDASRSDTERKQRLK